MRSILIFAVVCSLSILVVTAWAPTLFIPQQLAKKRGSPSLAMDSQSNNIKKQATFAIFTTGLQRRFEEAQYFQRSPRAYVEGNTPNTVFVADDEVTWRDFFETMPFTLTENCFVSVESQKYCNQGKYSVKFYINEKTTPDALDRIITDGDQFLITYGEDTDTEIMLQLSQLRTIAEKDSSL